MTVKEDQEQLYLELVNRARLDPAGEAARHGLADLSAGTGTTITPAPKQPLAPNPYLYQAAQGHNSWMASTDSFSHTGSGGSTSHQRMAAAGYGASGSFGSGENIAWMGTTGTLDQTAAVHQLHKNLFLSAGHRKNILNPLYEEFGASSIYDPSYQGYKAMLTTHNFAYKPATAVFVTGVHYTDTDNNDFYSIGESNAGRTVKIYSGGVEVGSGVTSSSGGYGVQVAANSAVETVFSGGGLVGEKGVAIQLGAVNVKVDLTDSDTIETNVSATLTRTSANLTLIGIDNVNGTGNELNNVIKGNKGDNTLNGAAGNDTLLGGDGTDILIGGDGSDNVDGGNGTDTVVFSGTMASYSISYNSSTQVYTFVGADGSVETVKNVENFQFADGTRTAAQLPLSGAPRTVSISTATAVQNEGNSGVTTYTFTVSLSAASTTSTSVNYTVAGNGSNPAAASDFSGALSGTVTFAPGETSKTITVQVIGDTVVESNETFAVTLSAPTNGVVLGTASVTATITNDDGAPPPSYNVINGNSLANTLNGTAAADKISGFAGNDRLYGNDGDDLLIGGSGADILSGGNGIDTASYETSTAGVVVNLTTNVNSGGDAASDRFTSIENLTGSAYNDTITGNAGANVLKGLAGNDTIRGEAGNDFIFGGAGNDTLTGGLGNDTFVFDTTNFGADRVTDFTKGQDKIQFSLAVADSFSDLTITGNGTNTVTISGLGAGNSVTINSATPLTLTADDFLFA